MKTIKFKAEPIEEDGVLFIEGWAVKYGVVDSTMWKDKMLYGCFTKSLTERVGKIKLLFEHDRKKVIGVVESYDDSPDGLKIKCRISQAEEDVAIKIKEGLYDSFSIGFYELKRTPFYDQSGALVSNDISEAKLQEVSLTAFPAYRDAQFSITKSILEIENDCQNENELIEKIKSLVNLEPQNSKEPLHSDSKPIAIDFEYLINNFKL